jgi:ferric-dicitrate binding protein FerR (iron transport regulator)
MDNDNFIKLWLEGDLKADAFEAELPEDAQELGAYKKIANHSSNLEVPKGRSKEQIWNELQGKIQSDVAMSKKPKLRSIFYYSAAVAVLFLGVLIFINASANEELIVKVGEHKKISLPDGSEVMINSVSKLSYSVKKWQKERLVQLEGEAFFKVKKGSRFTVESANGKVEVKGTVFNVYSRAKLMEVKCTEGIVAVSSNANQTVLLKENQGVKFVSGKKEMELFELGTVNKNLWLAGQYYFSNEHLENVFHEMERQFAVKIEFADNGKRTFSGYFSNKNLEQALQMVCSPMDLKFEIKQNAQVVVSPNTE